MNILLLIITAFCIFIASYTWFLFCEKRQGNTTIFQPTTVFLVLGFLGCGLCAYLIPGQLDALTPVPLWIVVPVFTSAILLQICFKFCPQTYIHVISLALLCTINSFLLPDTNILSDTLSPYLQKGLLAVIWLLFAWFYYILNNVDGVLPIQSLSIVMGLILMYFIGIMPELSCAWSSILAVIILSFAFFNNYPAALSLGNNDCRLLGFFIGWLILLSAIEGNLSCSIILSMYYIYELIVALIKKMSLQKKYKHLPDNTFYSQLAFVGIPPKFICEFIGKNNLILMLLAGIQIYAPNQYTIPLLAFCAVFWMTSRVTSPQNEQRPLLITGSLLSALFRKKKAPKDEQ